MDTNEKKVIVRFAPSPTGLLHVGGVRAALFNFLFARQKNGKFLLRIEDTDKERSKKEYDEDIISSLEWLGLNYNEKPLRQSERTIIYKEKLNELIKNGHAYISQEKEGENKEVVRFKNPGGKVKFQDLIRGEVEMDVSDLKDFIIAKSLNEPLYHLAVVVDDMESGITHVIRGEDHISNTPRQILIIEALGGARPIYAHLPLVLATDKSKLSKRKHGEKVSLKYYRELGYLPEAIINFLALIGWNPGGEEEVFTLDELVKIFDLEKVQKKGGIFNVEKLDWLNKEHMKSLPEKERNEEIKKWLEKNNLKNVSEKIYPIIFDRISKLGDIDTMVREGELDYFFQIPAISKDKLLWKNTSVEDTREYLSKVQEILESLPLKDFENIDKIKEAVFDYAEQNGKGQVLWPLRTALSGKDKSPDPFTLVYVLGKEESLKRISKAIEVLN